MASTLQIVDPDSTSTILFDLNDITPTNSGLYGSVKTQILSDPDFGSPKLDNRVGASSASRAQAFNRQAVADFKLGVRIYAASNYDNLNLALGTLAYQLSRGCTLKWIPNGSTETRYIDVLPSTTPVLLDGRELGIFEVTTLFDTPQGVTLNLQRLGALRGDKLSAATNVLVNPSLLRDSDNNGRPDSWSATGAATLTIAPSTNSCHIVASAGAQDINQSTTAASASVGQVWTASAEFKVTSGTASIAMTWRTSAPADISTVTTTTTTATWTKITISGTAPATTDRITVKLASSGAAATFDVRNVQLELAATASRFRVSGDVTMRNDVGAGAMNQLLPVYNPSDAPAPCEITVAYPDASTQMTETRFALISDQGITGSRYLPDYLNGPNYGQCETSANGWTVTLGSLTTSQADADGVSGNIARVRTTATDDYLSPGKRVTMTRTTNLDSLRGRWRVYLRVKNVTIATVADLQLRWGWGTFASEANNVVVHDLTNVTGTPHYVYLDMGTIEGPREKNIALGQLTLELWTNYEATGGGNQDLHLDHIALAPTDDAATVLAPSGSSQTTLGKLLSVPFRLSSAPVSDPVWTTGQVKGNAIRLNAANEAAGWGSTNVGLFTGATGVVHQYVFDIDTYHGPSGTYTAACQVVYWDSGTAGTNPVVAATQTISTKWGQGRYVLTVTDTNGKAFEPRVKLTAVTGHSYIDVNAITVYTYYFVSQNQKIRSDPGSLPTRAAVEQLDSSGNLGSSLFATGVPFWIPPGMSLVWINTLDLPVAYCNENKYDLTRTITVTPQVYPRWWQ